VIAQANADTRRQAAAWGDLVSCRFKGEFTLSTTDQIQYMDVAPGRSCRWPPR
jgi:DNA-directed RNA polymerase subunit beta